MRIQGWEARLVAAIEAARNEPYRLGTHDCFRVACQAVEATTGLDHWPQWAGKYSTRLGALKLITQYGGGFTEAASKLFGVEASPIAYARRGDIVEYRHQGEPHLGVCMGARMALLTPEGLGFLRTRKGEHCWRIG